MQKPMPSKLLTITLAALMMGLTLPALAGAKVTVNVDAIEYSDTFTVMSVLAVSDVREDPTGWTLDTLEVGGTLVDLDRHIPEVYTFPRVGLRLWVVQIDKQNLIDIGDSVKAVVFLTATTMAEDTATCRRGVRRITAICK